jgi:hypothetical protein
MGAGASALDALPAQLDEKDAKKFAGDKFNKAAFDKAAKNGKVSRDEFLKAAGAPKGAPAKGGKAPVSAGSKAGGKAPAGLKKGAAAGGGKGKAGGSGLIAKAKEAAAESSPAAASSSDDAAPTKPPSAPEEPPPPPPPPEPELPSGEVMVRYNHYDKKFKMTKGAVAFEDIDAQYAISFVFKGAWTCYMLSKDAPDVRIHPDGGLQKEMRPDPDGFKSRCRDAATPSRWRRV